MEKGYRSIELSEETQRKLANIVNTYKSLDEEGKSEFLSQARAGIEARLGKLLARRQNWLLGLGPLVLVVLVIVFFGYKLYKSLSERERKREEKKKNKQMKKKK